MATRATDYLCSPNDEIKGSKLPSKGQVLAFFLHLHTNNGNTIRDSATTVANCISEFWEKAKIPIHRKDTIIAKVEKLYKHYHSLKKEKNRRSATQKQKESKLIAELSNLFDVATVNALTAMTNEEDKEFLLAQREPGRRGTMGSADFKLAAMQKRSLKKQMIEKERQIQCEKDAIATSSKVVLESSSSGGDTDSTCDHDQATSAVQEASFPKRRRATKNVLTPQLAMALDRTKVNDRCAAYVLTETVRSIGQDPTEFNINRTSIQRLRKSHRKSLAGSLKVEFHADCPLVVHWDGKLLRDLTTREHVDRLPIVVTGNGVSQLLKVAKLPNGTGLQQAKAVVEALDDWDLTDKVVAMSFDTTASNTGRKQGACVLIEQELQRDLLHLACRHHILELLAQTAFTTIMGSTAAPEVLLFKRFQYQWEFLDKTRFTSIVTANEDIAETVIDSDLIAWVEKSLRERKDLRDDYREFIELSLIFIGVTPPRGIHFMAPGPMHHARWMSKVLYSLKIWIFHQQFQLTEKECNGLLQMCIFAVKIHLWVEAPLSAAAPNNDIKLFKSIPAYASINSAVSKAVLSKFCSHLWYLSEELVALAFFDMSVPANTKRLMVQAIKEHNETEDAPKRRIINPTTTAPFELPDLVTRGSLSMLQKLGISSKFMEDDPETWPLRDDYHEAAQTVYTLTVTNDHAERGVALIEEYNRILTHSEEQIQYLLQVVSEHRKKFPNCKKSTLTQ